MHRDDPSSHRGSVGRSRWRWGVADSRVAGARGERRLARITIKPPLGLPSQARKLRNVAGRFRAAIGVKRLTQRWTEYCPPVTYASVAPDCDFQLSTFQLSKVAAEAVV